MPITAERIDVTVVGTGLVQSILAAALARAGVSVLHVDRAPFYGGRAASLNLRELVTWVEQRCASGDINAVVQFASDAVRQHWLGDDSAATGREQFAIDLTPQLVLSRGPLVDVLVRTRIGQQLDFKLCTRTLVYDNAVSAGNSTFMTLPNCKEDIFANKAISLVDKRKLMRFFTDVAKEDEERTTREREPRDSDKTNGGGIAPRPLGETTFADYLSQCFALSSRLQNLVGYALAFCAGPVDHLSTEEGRARVKRYMSSLGVYGKGALLAPLYGIGELAQGFSRFCAVHGGISVLDQPALDICRNGEDAYRVTLHRPSGDSEEEVLFESREIVGWVDDKQVGTEHRGRSGAPQEQITTHHRIDVFQSNVPSIEHVLHVFPPRTLDSSQSHPVYAVLSGSELKHTPHGYGLLHIWTTDPRGEQFINSVAKTVLPRDVAIQMTASYRLDSAHDEFITMDESLTSVDNATDRARVLFRDMVRRLGLGDAVEFLPAALHPEEEQELLAILGESISTEEK